MEITRLFVLESCYDWFFNDRKNNKIFSQSIPKNLSLTGPLSGANINFETCSANWNIVFVFQPVN